MTAPRNLLATRSTILATSNIGMSKMFQIDLRQPAPWQMLLLMKIVREKVRGEGIAAL